MEFPYLASTSVSLRGIFWLYTSKDGSGASLADLLDLVVLFNIFQRLNFTVRLSKWSKNYNSSRFKIQPIIKLNY